MHTDRHAHRLACSQAGVLAGCYAHSLLCSQPTMLCRLLQALFARDPAVIRPAAMVLK